jgi:hypothetical protein
MPRKRETNPKVPWTGQQPIIKRIFHVNIQAQNCLKCLKIIEVIHTLNTSMHSIESHYHSDYNLLKRAAKVAMSDILDIIAGLK